MPAAFARSFRLLILALVAATLSVVQVSARAEVAFDPATELPLPSMNDTELVVDRGELLVGSWDGEIVRIDLSSGDVTQIPGTSGVGSLSLSADGSKVYGATRKQGTVVEVDLDSLAVRSWNVGGCPIDAIGREGSIFFIAADESQCNQTSTLKRLDMATEEIQPVHERLYAPTLFAVPQRDVFVVAEPAGITSRDVRTWQVGADGTATVVSSFSTESREGALLSSEGDELLVGRQRYALPELAPLEDLPTSAPTWASSDYVITRYPDISLFMRSGQLVNTFQRLPNDTPTTAFSERVYLVGTTMYVIASRSDGVPLLYNVPDATTPAPRIQAVNDAPYPMYVGDHVTLHGDLTLDGAPLADASVTLTELRDEPIELGTVTTDSEGQWSLDHVVNHDGTTRIEASYRDAGRTSFTVFAVSSLKRVSLLSIDPTESVDAEATITVPGSLTDDAGQPRANEPVHVIYRCSYPLSEWTPVELVTDEAGAFQTDVVAGACDHYRFDATYAENDEWLGSYDSEGTKVNRQPTMLWMDVTPSPALPGDDVTVTMHLVDDSRQPLPGRTLELTRSTPDSVEAVTEVTTDADGLVSLKEDAVQNGTYRYEAFYPGDTTRQPAWGTYGFTVSKAPTSFRINAPTSVYGDAPFTIDGAVTGPDLPAALSIKGPHGQTDTIHTDEAGNFSTSVTGVVAGQNTWTLTFAGDDRHAAQTAWVHVYVVKAPTELTVTGPSSAMVGELIRLSGRLKGVAGVTPLTITGTDAQGGVVTGLVTNDDGTFEATVQPRLSGTTTWQVAYLGDDLHQEAAATATVEVAPVVPNLTLRTDRATYTANKMATIFVNIGKSQSRHVTLTATRSERAPIVIFDGKVPVGGLTLTRKMAFTEVFAASTPADATHAAVSTSLRRGVRLAMYTYKTRPADYWLSGRWAIYDRATTPVFQTTAWPKWPGRCLRNVVQRYLDGEWTTIRRTDCIPVNEWGWIHWRYRGFHPVGVGLRVNGVFAGDDRNLRTVGPWTYFKFR